MSALLRVRTVPGVPGAAPADPVSRVSSRMDVAISVTSVTGATRGDPASHANSVSHVSLVNSANPVSPAKAGHRAGAPPGTVSPVPRAHPGRRPTMRVRHRSPQLRGIHPYSSFRRPMAGSASMTSTFRRRSCVRCMTWDFSTVRPSRRASSSIRSAGQMLRGVLRPGRARRLHS